MNAELNSIQETSPLRIPESARQAVSGAGLPAAHAKDRVTLSARADGRSPASVALETSDGVITQKMLSRIGNKADLVLGAERLQTSGAHLVCKGRNALGQTVAVKDNAVTVGGIHPIPTSASAGRMQNINDILMRQIFKNHVDCPVIPAKEAIFKDPGTGKIHFGIESPWVENLGSVVDVGAPPLSNPAQAAKGLVYSCLLMGNWDSTWHETNNSEIMADGVMSDGTPVHQGEFIVGDLGWAGQRGTAVLGMPLGSRELLHKLPPEDLKAAAREVTGLSDGQLRGWVDEAGRQSITGWNPKLRDYYAHVLIENRDSVKEQTAKHPHWLEDRGGPGHHVREAVGFADTLIPRHLWQSAKVRASRILDSVLTNHHMALAVADACRGRMLSYG